MCNVFKFNVLSAREREGFHSLASTPHPSFSRSIFRGENRD